jgi:hypothetical protein
MNFAELSDLHKKDLRDIPQEKNGAPQNGRVAFANSFGAGGLENELRVLPGYSHQTEIDKNFIDDMLRGNWEKNSLSSAFFCPENIKLIQNKIRRVVYDTSKNKYMIDDQSVDELKIIMRAMFYQYARNLDTAVGEQVADLNTKVVDWSVPHILSAVDHYFYYINDISHMPVPMQQPQNISRAGTKTMPMNPFV